MNMIFSRCLVSLGVCMTAAIVMAAGTVPGDAACPVSGKKCNAEKHVAFDGGQVYFCCATCQKVFEAQPAKFSAKAHHQMVSTGQFVQQSCPIGGRPVKAGTQVNIGGVEVGFCCNRCKAKVQSASPEQQITMVFGNLEKGFTPASK